MLPPLIVPVPVTVMAVSSPVTGPVTLVLMVWSARTGPAGINTQARARAETPPRIIARRGMAPGTCPGIPWGKPVLTVLAGLAAIRFVILFWTRHGFVRGPVKNNITGPAIRFHSFIGCTKNESNYCGYFSIAYMDVAAGMEGRSLRDVVMGFTRLMIAILT